MRFLVLFLLVASAWGAESSFSRKAKELDSALAAKKSAEVESLIEELVAAYADAAPEEQKVAIKSIGKAAASKQESMRHAAFDALAQLKAKGSSKYLKRWLSPPAKGVVTESHIKAIQSAGAIADKTTLALLRKLSDHKQLAVAFEATKALGGYRRHSTKTRKQLAIALIKRMEKSQPSNVSRGRGPGASQSTRRDTDDMGPSRGGQGGDDRAARRNRLTYGTRLALVELTGKQYSTVAEWSSWRKRAKKMKNPF